MANGTTTNPNPGDGNKVTLAVLNMQLSNIESTMKDIKLKLDNLPCGGRAIELERLRGNFRTLVIVLVSTGVVGGVGGGLGLAKLLTGG